jgi:hypothetical protein
MPEFRDQRLQIVIAGAGAIQLPAYFAELPLDPLHAVPDILARAARRGGSRFVREHRIPPNPTRW